MTTRHVHIVHALIRSIQQDQVGFLLYPHETWMISDQQPYLTLPVKKTVADPLAPFIQGTSLDTFVDGIMQQELTLPDEYYTLEQELPPAEVEMVSPTHGVPTYYTIYPVDVWVDPAQRESLRKGVAGQWLTCEQAIAHPQVSPTAKAVLKELVTREQQLDAQYATHPADEQKPEAPRRLLGRSRPARAWMRWPRSG
jgi:hypothetical protein